MKFIYSTLIVAVIMLSGCKQDFQIAVSKYVDTPVIYGLLSINDYGSDGNTHYVRIQKGYLLKGNAYLATGIIDSIYYPDNLTVKLIPAVGPSFTLTRVDGSTVGLNKDTGVFANTPNYLYTFHGAINANQPYTLVVTRNTGDTVATAVDSIVSSFAIYSPSRIGPSSINFSNTQPAVLTWALAKNADVYDLTVRFFYREYSALDNSLTKDTFIDIPVFRSYIPVYTGSQNITYTLTSSIILTYLSNNLKADPNVYREFNYQRGMQFKFAAGGNALGSYFLAQQAQSGLTSSNALPPYTNISGGVGLLSSRIYKEIDSIVLTPVGLDTLACDPTSANLNFRNSVGRTCH